MLIHLDIKTKVALFCLFIAFGFFSVKPAIAIQQSENNSPTYALSEGEGKVDNINDFYLQLKNIKNNNLYIAIDDLKATLPNLENDEAFKTQVDILEYYFWLDNAEGIRDTLAQLYELDRVADNGFYQQLDLVLYEGYALALEGDRTGAMEVFEGCLQKAIEKQQPMNEALAYQMIGTVDAFFDKYYTAIEKLHMALYRLKGLDDERSDRIRIGVNQAFAYVYTVIELPQKTVAYYSTSIQLALKHGLAVDVGTLIYNVGFLLMEARELDQAEKYFKELLQYYVSSDDEESSTYAYYALAFVYYYRQDYGQSLIWAERSYERGNNFVDFEGTLLQLMAENQAWLGNLEKAHEYMPLIDNYFEKYPDYKGTRWEARSHRVKAVIAHKEGRHDDAMMQYKLFHQAYENASDDAFNKDIETMVGNVFTRLSDERAEGELLRQNIIVEQLNTQNQRYLSGFIAFLLLIMVGLITFQMRWSKKLQQSTEQAKLASRSKSDFLAKMSHELRTPLNAIIGFSEMMNKEVMGKIENEKYKDYVLLINQSGLHLLRIINDILDISKVESGKLVLTESKFDLCELIEETVNTMSNKADRVGITLNNSAPAKCVTLFADRRIVKQVFFNILSNSIKFTPDGGAIGINYKLDEEGRVVVELEDNGMGMSDEHLQQAMEPFGQVKSVLVQSHEGTGLGLPLVQAFMESHGGSMKLHSSLGNGTKVELIFPKVRVF